MGALAILQATQSILSTGFPGIPVGLGVPRSWNSPQNFYLYHDQTTQTRKYTNIMDRHHIIPICLTVISSQDVEQDEIVMADFTDKVNDLFGVNHTLNGTARNCDCLQGNGRHNPNIMYMLLGTVEYRTRWWTLDAIETRQVLEAA